MTYCFLPRPQMLLCIFAKPKFVLSNGNETLFAISRLRVCVVCLPLLRGAANNVSCVCVCQESKLVSLAANEKKVLIDHFLACHFQYWHHTIFQHDGFRNESTIILRRDSARRTMPYPCGSLIHAIIKSWHPTIIPAYKAPCHVQRHCI